MRNKHRVHWSRLFGALPMLLALGAFGQANGKLQIHFMSVGNGDGAVLISPQGEIVFFDAGFDRCDANVGYLRSIGVTKMDYMIVSHYHLDHIACAARFLQDFPLKKEAIDRGSFYLGNGAFKPYTNIAGIKRTTAVKERVITLDSISANPVTIKLVAFNGNGNPVGSENDYSLVAKVTFGQFDAEVGGDLSGFNISDYHDIETSVASMVGEIELYKVHHHGSSHSSNPEWLRITKPKVGIISCGDPNPHGHPTQDTMDRLHQASVKCYWTSEGKGATRDPAMDFVGDNIVVQVAPGSQGFTVTRAGFGTDIYDNWGATTPSGAGNEGAQVYWWSTRSAAKVYHYSQCSQVNPTATYWAHSSIAPVGWRLHNGCPR